jgi:hypothetical protein
MIPSKPHWWFYGMQDECNMLFARTIQVPRRRSMATTTAELRAAIANAQVVAHSSLPRSQRAVHGAIHSPHSGA